jgi:two-component system LytT family response regulator
MKSTYKYTYCIIEDAKDVCDGIISRMNDFDNWQYIGDAQDIDAAMEIIFNSNPNLIFMDWDIKGSSTFPLLERLKLQSDYKPFIIFFTAFQNDEPQIPEKIHNQYKVHKYLVKPIWNNLSENLKDYLEEAVQYVMQHSKVTLRTIDTELIAINFNDVVYCTVFDGEKRTKSLLLSNGNTLIVKGNLDDIENHFKNHKVNTIRPNKRYSILNTAFIKSYKRPTIHLTATNKTLEVSPDNIKDFEEWYLTRNTLP